MNNVRTVFFAVAFGWLLGLVPHGIYLVQRSDNRMVAKYMEVNAGVPLFKTVLSLFPHGLLELPAFIISAAVALRTGWILLMCIFKKREWEGFFNELSGVRKIMVLVVVPLFLVAAFIEGSYLRRFELADKVTAGHIDSFVLNIGYSKEVYGIELSTDNSLPGTVLV